MNDLMLTPRPNTDAFVQEVDNEILILDRKDNKIHQLNAAASLIWKECDGLHSISDIVKTMMNNFDVSLEQAEKDVLDTIRLFQENNLLE